jgi:COMPASS component SWD3
VRWRPNSSRHKTKNILLAASKRSVFCSDLIRVDSDGTLKYWHVTSEKCVHTITEENNQIYAVDYRADAEKFATAGKDFKVGLNSQSRN